MSFSIGNVVFDLRIEGMDACVNVWGNNRCMIRVSGTTYCTWLSMRETLRDLSDACSMYSTVC